MTSPTIAPAGPLLFVLTLALTAGPPRPRDLDVGLPPGSPMDLAEPYLAVSPRGSGALATSGPREEKPKDRSSSTTPLTTRPLPGLGAHAQIRILTWDLAAHLGWIAPEPRPLSAVGSFYARPPVRFGEGAYWVTLAPLLRLLLHGEVSLRGETLAHLLQIGEPARLALRHAAAEIELRKDCRELQKRIERGTGVGLPPLADDLTPARRMWQTLVRRELLAAFPYDPQDDFGARLALYPDEVSPALLALSRVPHVELRRAAVAALATSSSPAALEALLARATTTKDGVELMRALDGLGRFGRRVPATPLVARLKKTQDLLERVALIRTLGRIGSPDAAPILVELAMKQVNTREAELLVPALEALARLQAGPHREAIVEVAWKATKAARGQPKRFRSPDRRTVQADRPDGSRARAEMVEHLAFLVRLAHSPGETSLVRELANRGGDGQLIAPWQTGRPDLPEAGQLITDPLGELPPRVRLLFIEALGRHVGQGEKRLRLIAETRGIDHDVRRHALQVLPYSSRIAAAEKILADEEEDPFQQAAAFEVLLADRHASAKERAAERLRAAARDEARPTSVDRYVLTLALRFLDREKALTTALLTPLLQRFGHDAASHADLELLVRSGVEALLRKARAGGKVKKDLDAWLEELEDRGIEDARKQRGFIKALLENLGDHPNERFLETVRRQIVARLLGRDAAELPTVGPWFAPTSATFDPPVPLLRDLLLALGGTGEPEALEALQAFWPVAPDEARELVALAMARTGLSEAVLPLLPMLLDRQWEVRVAASVGLQHLGAPEIDVDWIGGERAELARAAEELFGWNVRRSR